jgi:quercetin dioxygenase-like cupin family protein
MRGIASTLVATLLCGVGVLGQSEVVPVTSEPRHRQMLATAHVKVLDVKIPPGDTTLDHSHDRDLATVSIDTATTRTRSPGTDWSAPRPRPFGSVGLTEYTGKPGVHRVENHDTTAYHLIAIENGRDAGQWSAPKPVTAPGTTLNQQGRAFTVYDVRLSADTPRSAHVHDVPTLVVLLAGAIANQEGSSAKPARASAVGQWFLAPAGGRHELSIAGAADAHLIEVEAR